MRIIEYTDSGIYSFKEEDFNKTVYFFPEGLLVLTDNDFASEGTMSGLESTLAWIWQTNRIGQYGSESD